MRRITMMFDPKSYDLRQWTITDRAGQGHHRDDLQRQAGREDRSGLFQIDYSRNYKLNKPGAKNKNR